MIEFAKIVNALNALPEDIKRSLEDELKGVAVTIQEEARTNHNFTSRTGKLESSVKTELTDTGIRAYLDTGVAPYAAYIHNGTRYITPDPFLENAFQNHIRDIDAAIGRAVEEYFSRSMPGSGV